MGNIIKSLPLNNSHCKHSFSVLMMKIKCPVLAKLMTAGVFCLLMISRTEALNASDSSQKPLLASRDDKGLYMTIEANVVFPDLLAGNEEQVMDYIEKFSINRRDYLIRTHNRSKRFFPKVAAILKKHHLPQELSVLLALESAFNANAVSHAGAVGYWQFMDGTAKEYGLKVAEQLTPAEKKKLLKADKKKGQALIKAKAKQKDDRKNFTRSTYAAARYLRDRGRNLDNDVLLMVASYNCGIGNVWNAMNSSGVDNPSFWDIKSSLPAETQSYVMNFIALNVIFHNYEKFADNTLSFKPVKVKIAKEQAGTID